MILGGAGIANAQEGSLGSLTGSLDSGPVGLTVAGGEDELAGEITNTTELPLTCDVTALDADVMEDVEAEVNNGAELDAALADAAEGDIDVTADAVNVPEGESVEWAGTGVYDPEVAPAAGAVAECGEGENAVTVFAYESTGILGSLDMASLGS